MKYLLQISLVFILLASIHYSHAKCIRVGKTEYFKSIHKALEKANNGDTILVDAGVYREKNILISKSISLIGVNYPVLDGENKIEVLSVKANYVLISGFKIIHTGSATLDDPAGIKLYDCKYVTVSNNQLEDTFFGIYVQYGINCKIKNNTLLAFGKEEQEIGNGIHCWKSDSLQVSGNRIEGHRDGIYFEFVTNSLIWMNTSTKNLRYGLHFMFSNNDSYIGNRFINNGAGVAVMFTNKVKMFNNLFTQNWEMHRMVCYLKKFLTVILKEMFLKKTQLVF